VILKSFSLLDLIFTIFPFVDILSLIFQVKIPARFNVALMLFMACFTAYMVSSDSSVAKNFVVSMRMFAKVQAEKFQNIL
jgi:hypothetical protein